MSENQIDISLSLLSQQSGTNFQEFVKQLSEIQQGVGQMATSLNIHTKAMQEQARSFAQPSTASRPQAQAQPQETGGGPSRPTEAPEAPSDGGSSQGTQTYQDTADTHRAARGVREELGNVAQGAVSEWQQTKEASPWIFGPPKFMRPSTQPTQPEGASAPPSDSGTEPADTSGGGGGGGPSLPPDSTAGTQQGPQPSRDGHQDNTMKTLLPLELLSSSDMNKRQKLLLVSAAASQRKADATDPEGQDKSVGGRLRRNAVMAASLVAPKLGDSEGGVSPLPIYGTGQAIQNRGFAQGYQRTAPEVNIGGVGFEIPGFQAFSAAGGAGRREMWDTFKVGMRPGLSSTQAKEIYNDVDTRGYTEGGARNKMVEGLAQVVQKNPGMDIGQVGALQDQATRLGTESMQQFVTTMNQVPDVAHAAGIEVNSFLSQLQQVTDAQQKMGAMPGQAQENVVGASQVSGLAPAINQQLFESPYVQAQAMSKYGLPPGTTGMIPGPQQAALTHSTVTQLVNSFHFADKHIPINPDVPSLGTTTLSGKSQAIGFAATNILHQDPQVVSDVYHNKNAQPLANAGHMMQVYHDTADSIEKSKLSPVQKKIKLEQLRAKYEPGLRKALPKEGFSPNEVKDIVNAGNANDGDYNFGGYKRKGWKNVVGKKLSGDYSNALTAKARSGDFTPGKGTEAQFAKFNKVVADHQEKRRGQQKDTGNKVQIDLSPAAKQFFRVQGRGGTSGSQAQASNSANAGGPAINRSYSTGSTNLDANTAGYAPNVQPSSFGR